MRSNTHLSSQISKLVSFRLSQSAEKFMAALLPPSCLGCEQVVSTQGVVCAQCWCTIDFIEKPFCDVLGTPFSYDLGAGAQSAEAIAHPPPFERLRAVALYNGSIQRLVSALKFADRVDLAPWMARWMVRSADTLLDGSPIVVPVPLHRRRLFARRFNQSAELARHVALLSGNPYQPQVLKRVKATRQQVGLGVKDRFRNVSGAFRVPLDHRISIKGRRVVVVDDVYTTGATLKACARALSRGGAAQIDCLTFARVASGEE